MPGTPANRWRGTKGWEPEYRPFWLEVKGMLVASAPLHIGGGAQWSPGMDAPLFKEGEQTPIPGTSLRGVLRHHLLREHGLLGLDASAVGRLFGSIDPAGTEDAIGMASRLRVFDAIPARTNSQQFEVRDYNRHDPETGAAAYRGKFDAEVALSTDDHHYSFRLLYEGESSADPELELVEELLRVLEGGHLRVGAHAGKGMGRVRLVPGYRLQAFQRKHPAELAEFLRQRLTGPTEPGPFRFRQVSRPAGPCSYPPHSRLEWTGELQFDGPVLVRAAIPPEPDEHAAEKPDHVFVTRTSDGAFYLAGSSLRGALRAQARRICRSLGVPRVEEVLFGCAKNLSEESRKGCLEVGDGEIAGEVKQVYLDHVALDRITLFPVDGAKFSNAALESPCFRVTIRLLVTREEKAALALWRFLQRDLEDGRIWAGGGVTRGYGRLLSANFLAGDQHQSLVQFDWPALQGAIPVRGRIEQSGAWCKELDRELTQAWRELLPPSDGTVAKQEAQ